MHKAVMGWPHAALFAALASVAWLSPFAVDRLARGSLGQAPFDWPWLALHFADAATAIGLIAALAVAVLLRPATERASAIVLWLGFAALAAVFGLVPVLKATTGLSSDVLVAGLLPALDAQSYYVAGLDFLRTGHLTEWATRRPLTAVQLAGLLTLTDQDFRLTQLLLVAGCSAAALLVVTVLYRAWGWVAACLGAVSLFAFIYETLGTTMSESLGFTAGGAAFVLLWEGARKARPSMVLGGMAMLSIGLTARAGALFVLPALAVWAGWRFAKGRRFQWGWAAAALAAGSAGFVVSQALIKTVGAPGQMAFSNFASTLYGLVVGGEPWTRVFLDAPQLATLPEGEQAAAIYRLAWAHAVQFPLDPIVGVFSRYNDFLFNTRWHSYVPSNALRLPVLLLAIAGVVDCLRRRSDPTCSLLLAGFAGILLSVPFLGDGGSRVFAASHAFTAALVAAGAFGLQQWLARSRATSAHAVSDGPAVSNAAWVLAIAVIAPVVAALATRGQPAPAAAVASVLSCAPDQSAVVMTPRNSSVLICAPGSACPHGVRAESLRRSNIWKSPLVEGLNGPFPVRAAGGIGADNGAGLWLLTTGGQAMPEGLFESCARPRGEWLQLVPRAAR